MSTLEIIHFEGRVKMRADVFVKKRMETFQESWKNLWVGQLGTSPCKPPAGCWGRAWSFCCCSAWPATTIPTFSWCCKASKLITSEWTRALCHCSEATQNLTLFGARPSFSALAQLSSWTHLCWPCAAGDGCLMYPLKSLKLFHFTLGSL